MDIVHNWWEFEYFMGQCGKTHATRATTVPYDIEPADTEQLQHRSLPTLQFQAMLSNVKLTNYPYKTANTTFSISPDFELPLPSKQAHQGESLMWKIHHRFSLEMNEYQLRKSYLEVATTNQLGKQVAYHKINLYLIATGPFHINLAVDWGGGSGRISFDLKMSQIINLQISSRQAIIDLARSHPGQDFSYSIKTIASHNGACTESQPSYSAVIVLDKKVKEQKAAQLTHSEDLSKHQATLTRKRSLRFAHEIEKGEDLKWTTEEGDLPEIKTKAIASELHNTFFQILIWRYKTSQDDEAKKELFADTYVSFYKLFAAEAEHCSERSRHCEEREVTMTEKLQHFGREYGKGTFKFMITNDVYLRQYQICVRTEMGILKSYPIFGIEDKSRDNSCAELDQLDRMSEKVELGVMRLNDLETSDGDHFEIRLTKKQLEQDLEAMVGLLERTSYSPRLLYQYGSEGDVVKGQNVLLKVGMQVSDYLEIQDPVINDACWLMLTALIRRSQFSLHHMGFSHAQQQLLEIGKPDKIIQKKIKVASSYKSFLYKLLMLCLEALQHKGSEYEMCFAEQFSAYAYFRIPDFRKQILRLITRDSDPEISEWKGVEFNLTEDIREKQRSYANVFTEMFDWDEHFYRCLPQEQEEDEDGVVLGEVLAQDAWKERFSKRGLAFFSFVKHWVSYVEQNTDNRDIEWRYFPGFNRILKGFLVEMKTRPLLEYPDALRDAAQKLLANPRFLSPYIKVLFNKVSVYDNLAVIKTIDYLNTAFKTLQASGRSIPINFNYRFLFKGIKVILEAESSLGITSLLTLIYNHFELFHIDFRKNLSMYFMGHIFWKLFLNWSFSVREVFNHLLTYKIYRRAVTKEGEQRAGSVIDDLDIKQRFEDAISMVEDAYEDYQSEKRLENHLQQQHLYLKMRKKLQRRRQTQLKVTEIMRDSRQQRPRDESEADSTKEKKLFRSRKTIHSKKEILEIAEPPPVDNRRIMSSIENVGTVGKKKEYFFGISEGKVSEAYGEFDYQEVIYFKAIPQSEFVLEDIPQKLVKYVPVCLPYFRRVRGDFEKAQLQGDPAPPLKLEIAFDREEIVPDGADDW